MDPDIQDIRSKFAEFQQAMKAFDATVARLVVDANDPAGVQSAIHAMETAVDGITYPYRENPAVAHAADKAKLHYRAAILKRAKKPW